MYVVQTIVKEDGYGNKNYNNRDVGNEVKWNIEC